ncbi:MAG TPA: epoxyqueuosine reductase, partial [Pirellulales bacterium]|nr:epoxyqueuosine reductase [Pirellulales bacterium]
MNAPDLTAALKDEARRIGFHLAGACPAVPPPGLTRFHEWLQAGYAGQMQYLPDRAAAYAHPEHVLSGVRSVLMLAWPYKTVEPIPPQPGQG